MINWYKQKALFLLTICSLWNYSSSNTFANSLAGKAKECREIDNAYQEVYGFETEDSYINVCQLDDKFYYHRQSKLDSSSNLVLPAEAIFRGSVFQATVGKITYFVGIDSDRYYSSVMLNNNEIVLEPEVEPPLASEQVAKVDAKTVSAEYSSNEADRNSTNSASLELEQPPKNADLALVCINNKSALHPNLEGWQELIGKSASSVNKYADNNGHDFAFDAANPEAALITTQSGIVVNLGIAANDETVERVCIEPTENSSRQ